MKKTQIILLVIIFIIIVGGFVFYMKNLNPTNEVTMINNNYQSKQSENIINNNNQPNTNQFLNSENMNDTSIEPRENFSHEITIQTNLGEIVFLTYDMDAPNTVNNFISLAEKNYYDGVIFHRVIDKFMIQGGDPTGTGRGGPGYTFADELNPVTESYQQGYVTGTVAMANAGPDTNGSQFFIMVADYPLPNAYTIFGKVIKGQEVANAIAQVEKDSNDKPLQDVIMEKVLVKEVIK